jgi:hypothetical protein
MGRKIPLAKKKTAKNFSPLVEDYIASLTGWQRDVARELRKLIKSTTSSLKEEVKWGWPCYTSGGKNVCGFMHMRETVNFVLYRGADLKDPDDLIEGTGRSMRHVKLRSLADLRKKAFQSFIKETIRLKP